MRVAFLVCLCAVTTAPFGGRGRAGDPTPRDYSSKPLGQWIDALKDRRHPERRCQARCALGPEGPYAKVAVPALIDAFAHQKPPWDPEAFETLADYGPAVVPALLRALKRPEASVRAAVATALGSVRPRPVEAAAALAEAAKDPVPKVRVAAMESLGRLGRAGGNVIPALRSGLGDPDDEVRETAACGLCAMGRKSKPAVPALITALKDSNEVVRDEAALALGRIGPDAKEAVPALVEGLKNGPRRASCAQALGDIGADAKAAVPALVEALQDEDDRLRAGAASALGDIGPEARAAVPALVAAVKDKRKDERLQAVKALGKIGPDARAAIPVLMEALAERETYVDFRETAAEALGGIGPPAKAAVPALTAIVRNRLDESQVRKAAAEAVIKIDPAFAAREKMEFAYLNVRLGKVPSVKLGPRPPLSEQRKKRIKELIAELAQVRDPDYGMSGTLTGQAFAPLPGQEHIDAAVLTNQHIKPSEALRRLVEIGPDALPFLLEALDDKTPTKLKVGLGALTAIFGTELVGNPLNPLERRVLAQEVAQVGDEEKEGLLDDPYTVKVGDVCFVAIGQIVGRPYCAARYQPTAIVIINSPTERKALRDRVRALWSADDPAGKLLDSLLLDYATEGVFNGRSLNGWGEGSDYQVQAAIRLLYYFPKETAPLIADRLRRMNVALPGKGDDASMMRNVGNGVCTDQFIAAVAFCQDPLIRKALSDIFRRTTDPDIFLTVLPAVEASERKSVRSRLEAFLDSLPESEEDAQGDGYALLLALAKREGQAVKPLFERYLKKASLQRKWTMCRVLQAVHGEWAVEFLAPMLTDKRTGYAGRFAVFPGQLEPRLPVRLCDEAAETISKNNPKLKFTLAGEYPEVDRQIDAMRRQLDKENP